MWYEYNLNSENFKNISSQSGFLLLPHIFPCAVAVNKYLHRISNVSDVFRCLEHTDNCYIFFHIKVELTGTKQN